MKVNGKIVEVEDNKFYLINEEGKKMKFVLKKYAPILSGDEFVALEKLIGYKVTVDYDKKKYKYTKGNIELEGYRNFCNKVIYTTAFQ